MDRIEGLIDALGVQLEVVGQLGAGDLATASQCPGWDVEETLRHSLGVTMKFTDFASGRTDHPRGPTGDLLAPDCRAAFERGAADAEQAWGKVDRHRTCHLPFGDFSAVDAAGVNLVDVLAHTWDVAAVTGLTVPAPDGLWDVGLAAARTVLGTGRDPRHYDAERPVPPGASPRQRFLAYLGRNERGPAR